jgi:hypothetical protein
VTRRRTGGAARAATALACVGLALGGCSAAGEEPVVTASTGTAGGGGATGAVTLVETRPQGVAGARVVAYDVGEDAAGVSVASGDGPAESATVRVGDTVDVDGQTWQVVSITPGGGDGSPGSKSGEVVLAPQG